MSVGPQHGLSTYSMQIFSDPRKAVLVCWERGWKWNQNLSLDADLAMEHSEPHFPQRTIPAS